MTSKEEMAAAIRASVVEDLRNGAQLIEDGFWYRGTFRVNDEDHRVPIGVYADNVIRIDVADGPDSDGMVGGCLVTACKSMKSNDAVAVYLGLSLPRNTREIYELNDQQPTETGRQWAIDTLRATADAVERGEILVS